MINIYWFEHGLRLKTRQIINEAMKSPPAAMIMNQSTTGQINISNFHPNGRFYLEELIP